ncbi:hypothetical protein [Fibrobacter sp.]|uniref:hypothetical protein n=1 Tax=Fibrobacter sp. TaxID=35828 RepID=UPI003890EA11
MLELVIAFLAGALLGALVMRLLSRRSYGGTLYFVDSPYKDEPPMVGTIFNKQLDEIRKRKSILMEISQK